MLYTAPSVVIAAASHFPPRFLSPLPCQHHVPRPQCSTSSRAPSRSCLRRASLAWRCSTARWASPTCSCWRSTAPPRSTSSTPPPPSRRCGARCFARLPARVLLCACDGFVARRVLCPRHEIVVPSPQNTNQSSPASTRWPVRAAVQHLADHGAAGAGHGARLQRLLHALLRAAGRGVAGVGRRARGAGRRAAGAEPHRGAAVDGDGRRRQRQGPPGEASARACTAMRLGWACASSSSSQRHSCFLRACRRWPRCSTCLPRSTSARRRPCTSRSRALPSRPRPAPRCVPRGNTRLSACKSSRPAQNAGPPTSLSVPLAANPHPAQLLLLRPHPRCAHHRRRRAGQPR